MSDVSENDLGDRKRRFLRGLNRLLRQKNYNLEDDVPMKDALNLGVGNALRKFRNNLTDIYCLEFTVEELATLMHDGMTTGQFTEKYCEIIYKDRGKVDLNTLVSNSMSDGAVDLREMDRAPKFGLNGGEWCDVAEGPCSCGAWHH